MRTLLRIGQAIFDAAIVVSFSLIGATCASAIFAWLLFKATTDSKGISYLNWYLVLACAPILYLAWLAWMLIWVSVEYRLLCILLNYKKPSRVSSSDGLWGYLEVGLVLLIYSRERFVRTLPLVDVFICVPGLRQLVFRTYSYSVNIGFDALVLGRMFDPDLTDIGEGAIIGANTSLIAHNLLVDATGSRVFASSPIKIGARSVIGGGAQINMGAEIGADAIVEPGSCVVAYTKIGNGEVWGGIPARYLRMRNPVPDTQPESANSLPSILLDAHSESLLQTIVAQALHRPKETITPNMSHQDSAAWDSLAQLQMSLGLKQHFNIELRNQESFQLRSMEHLRAVVNAHLGSRRQ